jgi:pyrimidine-nucleoside phosphorylase
MLMAICLRGMDGDETRWLTESMLGSGENWQLASDRPELVDKHSTGGVGDTVSLVLAPLLSAVGVPVAMISGRGLGFSQGTLDKLEAMPGFRSQWDRAGTLDLLSRCGAAIVAQTATIAPADRVLYALRDITGTVPSQPLIVASVMSKKLALGAGALVLDVKWGSGAFRKTVAEALEVADALREVGRGMGVRTEALITDMNQPLCAALGTACEILAARDVLGGGGSAALREVTLRLAQEAMVLGGRDPEDARHELERVLSDGSALTAWDRFVEAHGGDPDPARLPRVERSVEVNAETTGYIVGVATDSLGWVAAELGAGRRTLDEPIDHSGGVLVRTRIGDEVEAGQPLATLLVGERAVDVNHLARRTRRAFEVGPERVEPPQLILGTVDEVRSGS